MKKLIIFALIISICICTISCSSASNNNLKNPREYIGVYDGEYGGYLDLKSNGKGTYKEKNSKAGNLNWFVDNYRLFVSTDILDYEIHADVHSFNNMLYFVSNNRSWIAERFNKRK